jgi:CheY-like chemotaxis protein
MLDYRTAAEGAGAVPVSAAPMSALTGKKILVVEDEVLIAEMVIDMLAGLGATVVGPATTIEAGLSLAGSESFDAAVLDINVHGERIDPIADLLVARGIPMLFATGYGVAAVAERRNACVIDKPYTQEKLASALARAMAMPKAVGP